MELARLRRTWIMLAAGVALIGIAGFVIGPTEHDSGWTLIFLTLIAIQVPPFLRFHRRQLDATEPAALAAQYRFRFFIAAPFAANPAVLGFMTLFFVPTLTLFLVGLGLSAALVALQAPTAGAIRREDDELRARGLTVSLSDALRQ